MAQFNFHGLDELMLDLETLANLPEDVHDEMLNAMADVTLAAQKAEAAKLGMYDGYNTHNNYRDQEGQNVKVPNVLPGQTRSYSTGGLARAIRKGQVQLKKDQRQIKIYFAGSRRRGNTVTKNSEIAFLNEYGTKTINARNFIWVANEKSAAEATQAAAEVYDRYLKTKNL